MIGTSRSVWGFDPRSVPGCQLWLDGADSNTVTLSGSNVTQWNDKSGNGYNFTQSTSGNQPTYSVASQNNQNTITFTSANSTYLLGTASTNFIGTNSLSVYGVFKTNDRNSGASVFSKSLYGSAEGRILYGFRESGTPGTIIGGIGGQTGDYNVYTAISDTYTGGSWRVFGFVSDRSGWTTTAYQNGTSIGTATISSNTTTNLTNAFPMLVGAYNNSSGGANPPQAGYYLDGAVGELLLFSTALTTTQRQQIEGYLAHKWGLTGYYDSSIPLTIPGCQLWLDPANSGSLTLSGANVLTISNSSGTGGIATRLAGNSYATTTTISGNRILSFPGGQIVYRSPMVLTGAAYTIFTISSLLSGSGYQRMINTDGPSDGRIFVGAINGILATFSGNRGWNDIIANTPSYTLTAAGLQIVTIIVSGSSLIPYINGTAMNPKVGTTGSTTVLDIGAFEDGVSQPWNGYIGDIIVYNSALTTTQRQTIEGYLAKKWGIGPSSSIPSTHPFSSIRPHLRTFQPTDVPGCQLWLDAADQGSMTLSGSSVTQWSDKSGNGYHMNTLAGSSSTYWSGTPEYPTIGTSINNLPTVNFKAQSGLKQATTLDGVKNLFWIGRIAAPDGSGGAPLYFLLGHDSAYDWHGGTYGGTFFGDVNNSQPGIYNASASLFTNDPNAVTNATFLNVRMPSAPNVSLLSVSGITGTTRYQGICYDRDIHIGWCGDLAEVIVFNTALTTSQRQQVEGYLARKWGISATLPSPHPFKSFPPASLYFEPATKYSALFNSSSLSVPSNSAVTLGTNNHTIEFWAYQTSRGQYDCPFQYSINTSAFTTSSYYMALGGYLAVLIGNNAGNFAINMGATVSPLPSLNRWHHYAIVRNGNTFTIYINGISRETATSSVNITAQSGQFMIGDVSTTTNTPFFGYITNFRLVNGTAVYTSNFIPSTSPLTAIPNTQILLQGLTDRSANAFTVTNNRGVTLSTLSPFPPP